MQHEMRQRRRALGHLNRVPQQLHGGSRGEHIRLLQQKIPRKQRPMNLYQHRAPPDRKRIRSQPNPRIIQPQIMHGFEPARRERQNRRLHLFRSHKHIHVMACPPRRVRVQELRQRRPFHKDMWDTLQQRSDLRNRRRHRQRRASPLPIHMRIQPMLAQRSLGVPRLQPRSTNLKTTHHNTGTTRDRNGFAHPGTRSKAVVASGRLVGKTRHEARQTVHSHPETSGTRAQRHHGNLLWGQRWACARPPRLSCLVPQLSYTRPLSRGLHRPA